MANWASDAAGCVRCYRCGVQLDVGGVTVDRIVPGRKGGRYVRGNIRPACAPCNTGWNRL
jgi:5-methylcytosine-specific restriction endonuclease McrA